MFILLLASSFSAHSGENDSENSNENLFENFRRTIQQKAQKNYLQITNPLVI